MEYRNQTLSSQLTFKAVAKYALLPGILPRLKNLSFLFSKIAFVFIQVLGAARVIDPNHPCLRSENIGRYRFAEIIAMAWMNLKYDRKHLPQVMMFYAVVLAIVITIAIVLTGFLNIFAHIPTTAHAQYFSAPSADTSGVPGYNSANDWAFIFLERVFGGSKETGLDFWVKNDGSAPIPGGNPWYTGMLIGMLRAYSKALLSVAIIMIVYLVVITLADAARSGKPFGEKFDSVWAPIRFAIAIGLLLPMSSGGYNGGQMLVFEAAELGSNLATNLWFKGIQELGKQTDSCFNGNGGSGSKRCGFVAALVPDEGYRFVRDILLVNLCVMGFNTLKKQGKIKDVKENIGSATINDQDSSKITYSFGPEESSDFCGQVTVPKEIPVPPDYVSGGSGRSNADFLPNVVSQGYRAAVVSFLPQQNMMTDAVMNITDNFFCARNKNLANVKCADGALCREQIDDWVEAYWKIALGRPTPTDQFFTSYQSQLVKYNQWIIQSLQRDASYGWASAGVFYLRMSYAMSALSNVITSPPTVTILPRNYRKPRATPKFPDIEVKDAEAKCKDNQDEEVCKNTDAAAAMTDILNKAGSWFADSGQLIDNAQFYKKVGGYKWDEALRTSRSAPSEAASMDTVTSGPANFITSHIFKQISDDSLHPLGSVINWGSTFMTGAELSYTLAITFGIVGEIPGFGAARTAAEILKTIGDILMVPGFILMFVVPLLPFLYFTFAIVEWVVSILEAVIGVPLWALTFITLEGDLLGKGIDGAKMLAELVLRPTMIIIALLVAVIVFSASVSFFQDALKIVSSAMNASDTSISDHQTIVSLGLIFVYMFGVYSLAISSFKMIDALPNFYSKWGFLPSGFNKGIDFGVSGVAAGFMAYKQITTASSVITKAPASATAFGVKAGKAGLELGKRFGGKGKKGAPTTPAEPLPDYGSTWSNTDGTGDSPQDERIRNNARPARGTWSSTAYGDDDTTQGNANNISNTSPSGDEPPPSGGSGGSGRRWFGRRGGRFFTTLALGAATLFNPDSSKAGDSSSLKSELDQLNSPTKVTYTMTDSSRSGGNTETFGDRSQSSTTSGSQGARKPATGGNLVNRTTTGNKRAPNIDDILDDAADKLKGNPQDNPSVENPKVKEAMDILNLKSGSADNDIANAIGRLQKSNPVKAKRVLKSLGLGESASPSAIRNAISKLRKSSS